MVNSANNRTYLFTVGCDVAGLRFYFKNVITVPMDIEAIIPITTPGHFYLNNTLRYGLFYL